MRSVTKSGKKIENVLMISLDCVRPEALGCYPQRYPFRVRIPNGARTPNIDQLFANGHRFDQAFTHAPFTPAAHASLLTGLIPPRHGIRTLLGSKLDDDVTTLAEILSSKGWQCGAVVGAQALSRDYGVARGFHFYDDDIQTGIENWMLGQRREAPDVTNRALAWLNSFKDDQPFCLFVHYFDAHNISMQASPVAAQNGAAEPAVSRRQRLPEPIKAALRPVARVVRSGYYYGQRTVRSKLKYFEVGGRYERYGRRYQLNQTAEIDTQVGRIVQTLSDQNRLDNTLIILFADHGDDFMEHGEPTHGKYLYDTTIKVPLIVFPRLGDQKIVKEQVRIVDIFPTVLSVLGIDIDKERDGISLVELLENGATNGPGMPSRKVYSETVLELMKESDPTSSEFRTCYAALRDYPWKLIWNRFDDTYELYRIDADTHERSDLQHSDPQVKSEMLAELSELAQAMPTGEASVEDAVVERLKSLGYL